MKHITLKRNEFGRDLLLSDVNGCVKELRKLVEGAQFNGEDRLFLLGNSINKGLYSYDVVKFASQKNVFPILGNAEIYMLSAMSEGLPPEEKEILFQQWDDNGGIWRHDASSEQLEEMVSTIMTWPLSYTINAHKKFGLVHAEPPFDDWDEFVSSEITYNVLFRATNGQSILQGARSGDISNVDAVVSGHIQLARPPVRKGKCSYINHGMVIGKKSQIYNLSEF